MSYALAPVADINQIVYALNKTYGIGCKPENGGDSDDVLEYFECNLKEKELSEVPNIQLKILESENSTKSHYFDLSAKTYLK